MKRRVMARKKVMSPDIAQQRKIYTASSAAIEADRASGNYRGLFARA